MFATVGAIAVARRRVGAAAAPLYDPARLGASISLSEGNARATSSGPGSNYDRCFVTTAISGQVYVEIEVVSVSGANCDFCMGDDDPSLPTNSGTRPGDGSPGWAWRANGDGYSATTPGSFTNGDILQAKIDTGAGTVQLAKNGGAYASSASFTAASGAVTWRIINEWFAGSSGAFRLPATPTYSVPGGFTWVGDL